MKKTMSIIAIFAVLLLTVSANTERVNNAAEGMKAPYFKVEATDGKAVSSSDFNGRFVIVSFWASNDASSRIAVNHYDRYVESAGAGQVSHVAVNFDRNQRLFREIVRRDGLNGESQFHVTPQEASDLIRKYEMENGLQSFLIAPDGRIAAVNPSDEELRQLTAAAV